MKALWLAALLAAPAPVLAARPVAPPAPEFPAGAAWINARPLTLEMMRGRKAVLVAFLNPTDLRSLRLLPALKAWFDRYALNQLMIVGVVTPDLELQKDPAWTRAELKRFGIEFPVVIDADRSLWNAYANDGWPALYLIGRKGRIVFDHLGESDYGEIEGQIRGTLAAGTTAPLPDAVAPTEPKTSACGHATADVAMGARAAVKPLQLGQNNPARNKLMVGSREGEVAVRGKWATEPDGLRLARAASDRGGFLRVVYDAPQALAVLAPAPGRKTNFFVKLDDQWLYEGNAGRDVSFDDDGRSYVAVETPRLYDLARVPGGRPHELFIEPDRAGASVHGFRFADSCIVTNLP